MRDTALCLVAAGVLGAACAKPPLIPPDSVKANQECEARFQEGNLDAALNDCERSLRISPTYAEALFNRGLILLYRGNYAEAKRSLQMAVDFNPQHARAHNDLGILAYQEGRYEAAEKLYRRALDLRRNNYTEARYNLALALKGYGEKELAKSELRTLLKQMPEMSEPIHCLGLVRLEEGFTNEAITLFTRSVALNPRNANYWRSLGVAYSRAHRYDDAEYAFNGCLDAVPNDEPCKIARDLLAARQEVPIPRPEQPMP
jgi:Flp pilus assembly protein TadD